MKLSKVFEEENFFLNQIQFFLGTSPSLDHAGTNVQLTITSLWLKLSDLDSGKAVYVFEMPNISFASGGIVIIFLF